MSPEKLARLASQSIDGDAEHPVHVHWGLGLSTAGTVVSLFVVIFGLQLLSSISGFFAPSYLVAAILFAVMGGLRWRKVIGEAVLARHDDTVVVVEARMLKRNPVRDLFREYSPGFRATFRESSSWWRAPTISIDGDTWFVAPAYTSDAKRWYSVS